MSQQPIYNHLPTTLKNRYVIQRHGFSLANNEKLICSNPDIAIPSTGGPLNTGYGLHEKGQAQVKESATLLSKSIESNENIVMFCSPFKRTVETAEIIQSVLAVVAPATHEMELRERFYGDFDMTTDENYHVCWAQDKTAPNHGEDSQYKIESPSAVCDRATKFIAESIEGQMEGKTVILVAHGDICQILLTAFMRMEAWRHREIEHIDTAQFRLVNF